MTITAGQAFDAFDSPDPKYAPSESNKDRPARAIALYLLNKEGKLRLAGQCCGKCHTSNVIPLHGTQPAPTRPAA